MHSLKKLFAVIPSYAPLISKVVCGLLLCAVITLIWWFVNLPVFRFDVVDIVPMKQRPLFHVDTPLVKREVLDVMDGNFFTVNLDSVRLSFEQRPWVRSANVRREWPNKLIVEVEEHQPLGVWGEDGQILSVMGDLFVVNMAEAEEEVNLFEFRGPDGSEKDVVSEFARLQKWFDELGLKPIAVYLSERRNWTVKLAGGLVVDLGRDEGEGTVRRRFDALKTSFTKLDRGVIDGISHVDLRYPNGMAIRSRVSVVSNR